jgi:hypothetical protein
VSEQQTKNIFNLEKPEEYQCWMIKLTRSLPTLTIQIWKEAEIRYLHFGAPDYIEAPIHWDGANFEIAGKEESTIILQKVFHPKYVEYLFLEDSAPVVYVERTGSNKYIVAHGVYMEKKDDTD